MTRENRHWKEVIVRFRSRTKHKVISYDLCVHNGIIAKTTDKRVVGFERKGCYRAIIAQINKCEGMEVYSGIFMSIDTKGHTVNLPVLLYEDWNKLFKRWEIVGRRVIIEKVEHCL